MAVQVVAVAAAEATQAAIVEAIAVITAVAMVGTVQMAVVAFGAAVTAEHHGILNRSFAEKELMV